eukprot:m.237165 g.237165  ORF g.237165 m.237165 type:complete len:569 (+) comp13093_c0_seq1:2-1708(+)
MAASLILTVALCASAALAVTYNCDNIDPRFGRASCGGQFFDLHNIWSHQWQVTGATTGAANATLFGCLAGVQPSYLQQINLLDPVCPAFTAAFPNNTVAVDCYSTGTNPHNAAPVGRASNQSWTFTNASGSNVITIQFFEPFSAQANLAVQLYCDPNAPHYEPNITVNSFSVPNFWNISIASASVCHAVPACGVAVTSYVNGPWPMFQGTPTRSGQIALNATQTCNLGWRSYVGTPVSGGPIIGPHGSVYIGTFGHNLIKISATTGIRQWEVQTAGTVMTPVIAVATPFSSANRTIYTPSNNVVQAIDSDTATIVWTYTHPDVTAQCTTPVFSDFNYYYTGVYFTCGSVLLAVNAQFGRVDWNYSVPQTEGPISAPSVDPINRIIFFGSNKALYGINGTGSQVFYYKGGVLGVPTISNHGRSVYFNGLDNQTYAVSVKSGLEQWSYPYGGGLSSAAIGPDCVIYQGSYNGTIYALDANAGLVRWTYQTGGRVDSSPAVDGTNTVYVGSYDGKLYALDGLTGTVKWTLNTKSAIIASPAIAEDGSVLIGTVSGYVYSVTPNQASPPCPA